MTGISIVELGDGAAGAAATEALAALGADVTTAAAGGSILRGSSPRVADQSIQSAVLDSRKHVEPAPDLDSVLSLIAGADAVVCDRVHAGPAGLPVAPDQYLEFVAAHNRGVWVTISAYGLGGQRAGRFGSDLTVAASAGWLSVSLDPLTGRPTSMFGAQALQMAGTAAGLAVCHSLSERQATGEAQHADVSAQAAAMVGGNLLAAVGPLLSSDAAGGSSRFGAPAGLYECRDGSICVMAMEQHQWLGLVRAIGEPEWTRQFDSVDDRIDRAAECNAALAAEFARWPRLELEATLQQEGVPAGATRAAADLLASPQFAARGAIRTVPVGEQWARVVDTAQRAAQVDGPLLSDRPRTIRGLRVLEASHVLAVPLAGAILGACGAEVVKLEDQCRSDSYRNRGPYIDGHVDQDWTAYHALANHSKHSLEVDLSGFEEASALLESADVLMENYGPRRAQRTRVDCYQAIERHPQLLAISSSGFGHTGPWAAYRAYAYNLHSAAGLAHFTRGVSGRSVHVELALADLMTGYVIATYVAAWAVGPDRRTGIGLDVAMSEVLAARFNAELAAADLGRDHDKTTQPEADLPFAPTGVYQAADQRWVAISVLNDQQWTALVDMLGAPASLAGARWAEVANRRAEAAELALRLAAEVGRFRAEPLVGELVGRGVAASVVWLPAEVFTGADRLDEAYLPYTEHPLWGRRRLAGLPWRLVNRPPTQLAPPPGFGNARAATDGWAATLVSTVDALRVDADESEAVARRLPSQMESTNHS